jgi:glycosyltransferase involved in cell wall biosynthesis
VQHGVTFGALALRPDGGGVSTYIRNLLQAFGDAQAPMTAIVQRDAVGELPTRVRPATQRPSSGVMRALAGLRPPAVYDLFHGLDVDLPMRPSAPMVTTVHDLSVFDVPWADGRLRAWGERLLIRRAVTLADAVIADSPFTATRIFELFGRDAVVAPLAPDPLMTPSTTEDIAEVRSRYGLPETFVLQVGTIEPRKDVATLATACASLSVPLVLAGSVMRGSTAPPGSTALGYVPRRDLPALYAAATVVAYLSVYEGFGLPPVEAMACGAPVVATRVASLGEVLGDGAELVPLRDVDAVRRVLGELLADGPRREELRARGLRRVSGMSWASTASVTRGVYEGLGVTM